MVKYSICITHRNNRVTVEASLRSILDQIDTDYEVVVLDAKSNDGSTEILRRYASEGKIQLIVRRCSRGRGRQIAFENSKGEIIVSNLDTDEVYLSRLKLLLSFYDKSAQGKVLLAITDASKDQRGRQNITIAPRQLLEMVGGWNDLNYGEDWDLWRRAARIDKFSVIAFPLVAGPDPSMGRPILPVRYTRYVSMIQLGRPVFSEQDKASYSQRIVYLIARFATLFKPKFTGFENFSPYDDSYLVQA